MISVSLPEIDENSALLSYYAASRGNFVRKFWDNLSVLSSVFENFPCRVPTENFLYRSEYSWGICTLLMDGRIAGKQTETNMYIERLHTLAGDRETLGSVRLSNAV